MTSISNVDCGPPPPVSVAIINYNGSAYLEALLSSLQAQTFNEFETLFIDNCSTDESIAITEAKYPHVRLISQSANIGFARAGNLAFHSTQAEFVALLNTDLRLEPLWLEQLFREITEDASIAAVASKMLFHDRPAILNGVGGAMNRLGYTWDRGMNEEDQGQLDEPGEVLFASAGAAIFRRSAFLRAGGFDEKFFMYHEDVDLCWRLWLLGFRIVTAPKAVVYHHFGAATRATRGMTWRESLGERNNIRALLKNYEAPNALRSVAGLLTLRQPWRRKSTQLKNFAWNGFHLLDTLRHRRRIQRRRVRTDNDLKHLIVQSNHVPVRL